MLKLHGILDTPPEPAFDELAEIASGVCETPVALVSLLDGHRQWHKAERGLGLRELPIEASICAHAVRQSGTFVVEDLHADKRFRDNPLVNSGPCMRFYAGAPIVVRGESIGTVCVIDRQPRRLSPDKLGMLEVLARQAASQIELREALRDLDEARRASRRSERFLRGTLDALADHIAIVDAQGRIAYVNRAWEEFARANAEPVLLAGLGAGADYLEVCKRAAARGAAEAVATGAAIRAALAAETAPFFAEYPCHSPDEQRWFIVRVTTFVADEARYAVVSHQNITARKFAEDDLQRLNEELETRVRSRTAQLERAESDVRHLTRRLLTAEESERRALGRELHDRVGQNLSALSVNLQLVHSRLLQEPRERLGAQIEAAQRRLEETTRDVRNVMAELRPPGLDDYGLLAALRNHAGVLATQTRTAIEVSGAEPSPRPGIDIETALFRIAQEALANALKHARASRIAVHLEANEREFSLRVIDDGVGFDPDAERAQASWGMLTMRERAEAVGARLIVDAAPGRGTRLQVIVQSQGPA